jgi:hypothetical protein
MIDAASSVCMCTRGGSMTHIRPEFYGRLGNNLFQYCFLRLLAEKHNKRFNCSGFDCFPNTQHEACKNQQEVFLRCRNIFDADIEEDKNYRIRGLFQNYCYFIRDMPRIKEWLYKAPLAEFGNDDLLLSVRLGDFQKFNVCLPFSYYESAIRLFNCRNIYIMTDDAAHPFIKQFETYNPMILRGDSFVHFVYGLVLLVVYGLVGQAEKGYFPNAES